MSGNGSPTATGSRIHLHAGITHVGHACQGFVVRAVRNPVAFPAPDHPMDTVGVACRRGEKVHDQQMDAGEQGLLGLVDEGRELVRRPCSPGETISIIATIWWRLRWRITTVLALAA